MKLFYRKYGQGQAFIILHGLFGQSDNWNTFGKQVADQGFEVYIVDLRNHGLSPHSEVWNYQVMSDDILELLTDKHLQNVVLLGHSMGGKVAMQFAVQHQQLLNKLIVVDIAPKYYPQHHQHLIEGLSAVDFNVAKTRRQVEEVLSNCISDVGTIQFLAKNVYWKNETELAWRFNLKILLNEIENAGEATPANSICNTPALFIRGEKSSYIVDEDRYLIHSIFPESTLETIANSGHWVHAEQPKAFFECVMKYLGSSSLQ